ASGFLLKDAPLEELTTAIRHVHAGDAVVAPSTTKRLLDRFAAQRPAAARSAPDERLDELTAREREVLVCTGHALSNAAIAEELAISDNPVRGQVPCFLTKHQLRDCVQAVHLAHRLGLGPPAD